MQNKNILITSFYEVKEKYQTYFTVLLFALFGSGILIALANITQLLSSKYFQTSNVSFDTYLSIRLTYLIIAYILFFVFFSYVNGLLILNSMNKLGLRKNIKKLNKSFINFIFLSIFLLFIGLLATSPVYAILFVFLSTFSFKILAYGAFALLFLLFVILFSVWFILSPYVMLDKEINLIKTIKKSFKIVRKHEGYMILKILIAFILFFLIQLLFIYSGLYFSWLTLILNLLFVFFVIPYFYSYFNLIYKKIK